MHLSTCRFQFSLQLQHFDTAVVRVPSFVTAVEGVTLDTEKNTCLWRLLATEKVISVIRMTPDTCEWSRRLMAGRRRRRRGPSRGLSPEEWSELESWKPAPFLGMARGSGRLTLSRKSANCCWGDDAFAFFGNRVEGCFGSYHNSSRDNSSLRRLPEKILL